MTARHELLTDKERAVVMAQAAARAYPTESRLAGETIGRGDTR